MLIDGLAASINQWVGYYSDKTAQKAGILALYPSTIAFTLHNNLLNYLGYFNISNLQYSGNSNYPTWLHQGAILAEITIPDPPEASSGGGGSSSGGLTSEQFDELMGVLAAAPVYRVISNHSALPEEEVDFWA
jgi:hypothetical protein